MFERSGVEDDIGLEVGKQAEHALAVAHIAYYARQRLPLPSTAGGLLEDAIVVAVASRYR